MNLRDTALIARKIKMAADKRIISVGASPWRLNASQRMGAMSIGAYRLDDRLVHLASTLVRPTVPREEVVSLFGCELNTPATLYLTGMLLGVNRMTKWGFAISHGCKGVCQR